MQRGCICSCKGTDYTYKVYKTRTPSETEEPITNPTDAGTYYVKIAAVDGSAYTGETTVAWTVNKADLTNDNVAAGGALVNGVPSTLTYNGDEQEVKIYYKKDDNTYIPLNSGIDYDLDETEHTIGTVYDSVTYYASATDVGNYNVFIIPKGNYKLADNYNSVGAIWSITKADLKAGENFTAPVGSSDLKYTGEDVALLEKGKTGSVDVDIIAEAPVGTMYYAATRYRAVKGSVGFTKQTLKEVLSNDGLEKNTIYAQYPKKYTKV